MKYIISFNATTTYGKVVGSPTFWVTTPTPLDIEHKYMSLQRLCVEYARLIGISCSFAEITSIEGVIEDDQT